MTDRIVQTTWTDAGRHQPLPPPEDTQGDEIERLTARVAELEAMRAKERDEWDGCAKDLDRMLSEKEANRVVLSIEKEKQSERIVVEAKLDSRLRRLLGRAQLLRIGASPSKHQTSASAARGKSEQHGHKRRCVATVPATLAKAGAADRNRDSRSRSRQD
jgi:hypothetical protein